MKSTPADTLIPFGAVAICALGLIVAGKVASPSPTEIPGKNKRTVTESATNKTANVVADPQRALAKFAWQPQPAADQPITRIGFGACLHQGKPQPIWNAILKARPQTFLMLGDNVYGDIKQADGAELSQAYKTQAKHPGFTKARAALPMLATWDDHDYGRNDAGGDFEHKTLATNLFREFWKGSGTLDGRRGPGISYAHTFGPAGRRLQLIVLDTRSFRSPLTRKRPGTPGKGKYAADGSKTKTILGKEQWQWLAARLKEPADIRLIASSIQVLAEGHRWERWGNISEERKRLFRLLDKTKARGVIFLSGDRHRAAFYRMERKGKPPLVEATSSALNYSFPDRTEKGPHQLMPMFGKNNFGMIEIDWDAHLVTLSLRGVDGVAAGVLAIPFGVLG